MDLSSPVPLPIQFVVSAGLVLLLSRKLSKYADALEQSGLVSAVVIGTFFLAIVTSLPEAVATIGAAIMEGAIPLGVGNLLGSNMFNLLILVILDVVYRQGPLLLSVESGIILQATTGIILMAIGFVSIAFYHRAGSGDIGGAAGAVFSSVLVIAYWIGARLAGTGTHKIPDTSVKITHELRPQQYAFSTLRILSRLFIYACLLVVTSIWLLRICDEIAITQFRILDQDIVLGRTVTGSFLLSAATSFPELFVCLATLRLGQVNMAVANLVGSNMVNMLFLPIMHLASRNPAFYASVNGTSSLILISTSVLMTCILIVGLHRRSRKTFLSLGLESYAMLFVYLVGTVLVLRTSMGQ